MSSGGVQFGRGFSLQLVGQQAIVEVGSDLRVRFQITANDIETPNAAVIRVYNLSSDRIKYLISEFTQVTIAAGYGENIGTIFKGQVKQYVRGKERNVDSFLEIRAADGDLAYNKGFVNDSLPGGASVNQQFQSLVKAMDIPADPSTDAVLAAQPYGGILPRGKVRFGLARYFMSDLAKTANVRWSIQNGRVVLVPITGYLAGDVIKINSTSGMVGVPEATEQGITVTCLLNPAIQIGYRIQLNEADVTETVIKNQLFPGYRDVNFVANVDHSTEGFYRVIVIEHEGDTRGQEWYTKLVCLKIDPSAAPTASVQGFPGPTG
jgi:hypothetical protein